MSFEKQSQDYFNKKNISDFIKEAISMEQTGRTGFYYPDKKRAANLLKNTGVQFPSTLVANNSDVIIRKIYENVNTIDKNFLKYVPNKFLSKEQIKSKREAQEKDYIDFRR